MCPCAVNACVFQRVQVPSGKGRLPSSNRSGEGGNEVAGAFGDEKGTSLIFPKTSRVMRDVPFFVPTAARSRSGSPIRTAKTRGWLTMPRPSH